MVMNLNIMVKDKVRVNNKQNKKQIKNYYIKYSNNKKNYLKYLNFIKLKQVEKMYLNDFYFF